jgi:hypothetical protein
MMRTRPAELERSPLLKARCVRDAADGRPAPTQEVAAERLGIPFSTFRRHLTKGVKRVVDWMWQRETGFG